MFDPERIAFDPQVKGGRACIRGMRITVSLILNLLANGMTKEEIVMDYPYLQPEDIQAVLGYAARLNLIGNLLMFSGRNIKMIKL